MYEAKECEGDTCTSGNLRRRVEPSAEELDMGRKGPRASAITDRHVVNSVGVKNPEIAMAGDGEGASHARVVEVDGESQ